MLHLANNCCLDLTSQADSIPFQRRSPTLSFYSPFTTLPSLQSSLFLVFLIYSEKCWWCNSTPPPPLPCWQLSLRIAKILYLWQLCFLWFFSLWLGPTEGSAMMSHRKSKLSYSLSCTLPPPFFLFSDLMSFSVCKQMLISPFCAAFSSLLKWMLK